MNIFLSKVSLRLFAIAVLFISFAGYNFIRAYDESVWFPPMAGTPPEHNVAEPINTGTTNQIKDAAFGVNGLSVNADYPTIVFVDPSAGSRLLYMQNHTNTFNLLGDRNGDGKVIWTDDQPQALSVYLGTTPDQDYTYINNQVRANEYCDASGNNCSNTTVTGGLPACASGKVLITNTDGKWACGDMPGVVPNEVVYLSAAQSVPFGSSYTFASNGYPANVIKGYFRVTARGGCQGYQCNNETSCRVSYTDTNLQTNPGGNPVIVAYSSNGQDFTQNNLWAYVNSGAITFVLQRVSGTGGFSGSVDLLGYECSGTCK